MFNVAVGETNSNIEFLANTVNSGGSKRKPKQHDEIYYFDKPKLIKIEMKTLDEILGNSVCGIDLIVIDIEGSEYFALKGMKNILPRTKYLVSEFIPHHLRNVSAVPIKEYIGIYEQHFEYCYVPEYREHIKKSSFQTYFTNAYNSNLSFDGLVFSNEKLEI